MISARGLRIDNKFKIGTKDDIFSVFSMEFDRHEGWLINDIPASILEPIPLTPELLIKCGFCKISEETMSHPAIYHKTYIRIIVENNFDIQERGSEWFWIEGNTIVELKHLHQLQNLYYSLTNEEIKIEL